MEQRCFRPASQPLIAITYSFFVTNYFVIERESDEFSQGLLRICFVIDTGRPSLVL